MAKANVAPAAAVGEGRKGKSRTLYMTDEDWDALTKQARRKNRTRSGQVNYLREEEDRRDDHP